MREVNLKQLAAASSETARDINRRIVLNLIRNRQPLSRADLARISGLQRSTVSLIIEDLIEAGWVEESSVGHLPRGRRPVFLTLNEDRAVICVDIRPTQTSIAIGDVNGRIRAQRSLPTLPDAAAAVRELAKGLKQIVRQNKATAFEGIGISVPGRIDASTNELIFAPNLKWPAIDIKTPLERATGLEVQLENAANACALAELWFGNAAEVRDLVAVTVSEGIGAGIIAHGQLITGRGGMAGEFGHVPLDPGGPRCSCGNNGCWEVLASNRAALRYYQEAKSKAVNGVAPTFSELLRMADTGDPAANEALSRMAAQLARGTRMIVAALAPETITFIGEFTAAWNKFKPAIEQQVRAQSISSAPPQLVPAHDGAAARVRGTTALVFQKHFGAPM